jgi:hypothetical protein
MGTLASTVRNACLVAVLVIQLVGCGTILHPERRGQAAGKVDADIVILDAIGLVFFFLPGVIAFAVDFSTGAIYLPKGETSKTEELLSRIEIRDYNPESRDLGDIVAVVEAQTGLKLDPASLRVIRGHPEDAVESHLRALNARIATTRERRADG